MKHLFTRKRKLLILFVTLLLIMNSLPVSASDDSVVFETDCTDAALSDFYSDWNSSDWNAASVGPDGLTNSSVLIRKDAYANYGFEFDVLCARGSHTGFSKTYAVLRQPAGYMISGDLLALDRNDLGNENKSARPGRLGILFGFAKSEIDVIVHTLDEAGSFGNIHAMISLPEDMEFKNGVEIEIRDSGSLVELFAGGQLLASILLEQEDVYSNLGYQGKIFQKAVIQDADGQELVSTETAIVPQAGSVGFLGKAGDYVLKKVSLTSLSGVAQEAVVKDTLSVYTPIAIPKTVEESTELGTKEICVLIIADVVLIGAVAIIFLLCKNRAVRVGSSAALLLVIILVNVLILTGIWNFSGGGIVKEQNQTIVTEDGLLLDAKGNSIPAVIASGNQRATDALGRELPGYEEVGGPKEGKYVGVFYTLWTMSVTTMTDNTRQLARDPLNTTYGPVYSFHWWGEPEVGYATSTDAWVVRRNLQYLALAGVDYIYLDFTNAGVYEEAFELLLETSLQMRSEGIQTPGIVPWAYGDDSGRYRDIGYIYRTYYTQERYRSLWFYMDGKPLAMIKRVEETESERNNPKTYLPALNSQELCDFFTFRFSWVPSENDDGHYPGQPVYRWSWGNPLWMHNYKEDTYAYGWDEEEGKAEQVTIIVGGYSSPGNGRSDGSGTLDQFNEKETSGDGIYLQKQFDWVMENHPEVEYLNISGWNEWVAQYYPSLKDQGSPFGFVDAYNREFSRDMEPMKGGYTDNYFYQLCSIVRQFKGVEAPAEQKNQQTIDIEGGFEQWQNLTGSYEDYVGDTAWRDSTDPTGTYAYVNETGRNDIVESKVAYDSGYIYFYVRTADEMTPYTDRNWMLLFIDADDDTKTGWEGYDYLLNFQVVDGTTTTICAYQNDVWTEIGLVQYQQSGTELQIAVPRKLIGETQRDISFGFHWLDNVTDVYDLSDWFLTGDSAPERRNQYVFCASCDYSDSGVEILPARTEGAIRYMEAVERPNGLHSGLYAQKFHLTTNYGKQPEINLLEGTGGNQTLSAVVNRVGIITEKPTDAFALSFDGYIDISEDGKIEFTLTADDGAVLYIDGRKVIDISGVHTKETGSGSLLLAEGLHEIRIEYFENGNGNSCLEFSCSDQNSAFMH